jgi:dipeptidase E
MSDAVWEGLRLIDYNIAVDYGSGHSDSAPIERTVAYYRAQNMPHITLRDGEALVVDGENTEVAR